MSMKLIPNKSGRDQKLKANEVGTYLNSGVGFDDSAKILLKHSLVKAVQVLGDNLVLFQLLGILLKGL